MSAEEKRSAAIVKLEELNTRLMNPDEPLEAIVIELIKLIVDLITVMR